MELRVTSNQILALIVILCCAALLHGQSAAGRTVEADEFVLRDSGGKVRIRLSMAAAGPAIAMYDSNETARMVFGVSDDAPRIFVTDPTGKPALILGRSPDGPFISLTGVDGKSKTEMQTSSLHWIDSSEEIRMALELLSTGPAFRLSDRYGKPQAALAISGADVVFGLSGPNSEPQIVLASGAQGPSLSMHDTRGAEVLSLPK